MYGVLHGKEMWTIGEGGKKRLLTFEVWCCRRMLTISWKDHVTNEDVFKGHKKPEGF